LQTAEQAAENFGTQSVELARTYTSISACCDALADAAGAEEYARKAIDLDAYKKACSAGDRVLASDAYYNLAVILYGQNKREEANVFFKQCIAMRRLAGVPQDDPTIAEVDEYIAGKVTVAAPTAEVQAVEG
jgi:tetratricopeptide (TPR) repeat protein